MTQWSVYLHVYSKILFKSTNVCKEHTSNMFFESVCAFIFKLAMTCVLYSASYKFKTNFQVIYRYMYMYIINRDNFQKTVKIQLVKSIVSYHSSLLRLHYDYNHYGRYIDDYNQASYFHIQCSLNRLRE